MRATIQGHDLGAVVAALARVVSQLVPFIEKHRPIDDLDGLKMDTQGQPYRHRWDDLVLIAKVANGESKEPGA